MSTAILENETATVSKVSRSAIRAYRESVARGECDETILFNGRKLKIEWDKDRTVYLSRVQACESLRVDLPKLEAAAAEAAKAVMEAKAFAGSPLPDNVTVGDLRQRLHAANYTVPVGTLTQLGTALQWFANSMPDGYLGRLGSSAIRSHAAVSDCRSRAEQVLYQSTPDQRPDSTAQALQQQIEQVKARISERRPVLQAEELIVKQRAHCESLARGDISPPITPGALTVDDKSAWLTRAYRAARARLDELMGLLAGRQDAETANAKDIAELGKLNVKLQAANESRKARMFAVENMRWAD